MAPELESIRDEDIETRFSGKGASEVGYDADADSDAADSDDADSDDADSDDQDQQDFA